MATTGVRQMLLRLAVGVETRLPGYRVGLTRPRLYFDGSQTIRTRTRLATPAAAASAKGVHAAVRPAVDRRRSNSEDEGLIGDVVTESKAATEAMEDKTEVWYDELMELLDAGKVRLIDVRKPVEIDDLGMIPSSINIPMSELTRSLGFSNEQFRAAFGVEKPCKYKDNVVFYAKTGDGSAAAIEIARRFGYHGARHYVGGWYEWSMMQDKNSS